MVRRRYPQKSTLAVGDGANDVSMILQAHVGVGICGKEGQQAARSADYAIGQFKYLKPLIFFHGREAYRRNSMLILYVFYKNFLYVLTQFYFGFYSSFSGQPLYEQFIYQLYNITMTSLPIMWYAIYDFEHERAPAAGSDGQRGKHFFMRHPLLYRIGLTHSCFSNVIFAKWIVYAFLHALLIYLTVYYVLAQPQARRGDATEIGLWIGGMTVYGVCIFVANVLLAVRFHNHNWISITTITLGMLAYFVFYSLLSAVFRNEVDRLFGVNFGIGLVWLSIILCVGAVYVTEKAAQHFADLLSSERQKNESLVELMGSELPTSQRDQFLPPFGANAQTDSSVSRNQMPYRRRMSSYAFSQAENANLDDG